MNSRKTSLSANIIQFCRFLRLKGFTSGMDEESTALQALQLIDFGNSKTFFEALKAVLCRNREQVETFGDLYNEYWKKLDLEMDSKEKIKEIKKSNHKQNGSFKSLKSWLYGNHNNETEETATYSTAERFVEKDFSAIHDDENEEIKKSIKALAKRLAAKLSHRYEQSPDIFLPDIRRTLRKNLRRGGELLDIVHKRPKPNRSKLVVICDVSRSMELYTVFLIQFMFAVQQVYRRLETFIFSTSLKRVTSDLRKRSFSDVKHLLGNENLGWGAGTRIGESLNLFVEQFGRKLIDSGTIVIIMSDGWDTGELDKLETSMQYIHSRAKKVIWLNPLSGFEGYKPEVAGMLTALPYIDVFAPVHNLESLRQLGRWL